MNKEKTGKEEMKEKKRITWERKMEKTEKRGLGKGMTERKK